MSNHRACICTVMRMVYLIRVTASADLTFYISQAVLLNFGEVTGGFLIIGILAFPTAVKALPLQFRKSLLKAFWKPKEKTHRSYRSWPKSTPKKRPDPWEISELDTYDLMTDTSLNAGPSTDTIPGRTDNVV